MADLTIDQLPEATSISNDDIMIVAAANSSTAKKIKASLVVGRPSPGSGHVIVDGNGADMPQRPNLQFAGETVSVMDDPTLGRTVVEVAGSELKPATTTTLGGVIVGKNIDVDAEGVISTLGGHTIQNPDGVALEQQPNLQFTGDFTTVTNPADSQKTVVDVTVPPATTQKPGIVQVGGGIDVDASGVISTTKGHEVVGPEGNIMAQEDQIQFTGDAIRVTDDPTAKRTTVDVTVPLATAEKPGIVQVGTGLSITSGGVLSSSGSGPAESFFMANASLRFLDRPTGIISTTSTVGLTAARWFCNLETTARASFNLSIRPNTNIDSRVLSINQPPTPNFYWGPRILFYPLTKIESAKLAGKTVTFSFDFASNADQTSDVTIKFIIIGTTSKDFQPVVKIDQDTGVYLESSLTVGQGDIKDATKELARKSFTFDIPKEITQLCLQWTYESNPTSIGVGDILNISQPKIEIGSEATPYEEQDIFEECRAVREVEYVLTFVFGGTVTPSSYIRKGGENPSPKLSARFENRKVYYAGPIENTTETGFLAISTSDLAFVTNSNFYQITRKVADNAEPQAYGSSKYVVATDFFRS